MVQKDQQTAVKPSPERQKPEAEGTVVSTAGASAPAVSDKTSRPEGALTSPPKSDANPMAIDGNARTTILNGEIEILVDDRIPHLDKGPVKAYAAKVKGDLGGRPYFAMVCEPSLIPRSRLGTNYAAIINPNLVKLIASGTMYWPPAKAHRYCFVYENTLGHPLLKPRDTGGLGWRQDKVMSVLIKPLFHVLLDLRDASLVHGDIRPSNLFTTGDQVTDRVVLGECLSTPTGFSQPVVFETIERALCDPIARGKGTPVDDLYAFGVTLACILRKKDPLAGKNDEEIIREKIKLGSYGAIIGAERFTGATLELLRGLLYDDSAQRWTHEEVLAWMDGQRLSPKQSSKKKKASRPLPFNEKRYTRPSLLAMDLNNNQAEAIQLIDDKQVEQWVNRSLEDPLIESRLEQALERALEYGRGPGYWDRLLSRVSIALDPEAPIRYKGLKLHPEGIPTALARAVIEKEGLQPYVEIINQQLVLDWLNAQSNLNVDVGALVTRNDSCRTFLRQSNLGYGIERCLYFLDAEIPCLSEKVLQYYARSPEELMFAFEDIARGPDRPYLFIDRHVAAFLSVRDKKVIDGYWSYLNAEEEHRKILGNLFVLATIQKRERMPPLPGISRWVAEIMGPVYERYHDRELREELKKKVAKLADSGDVTKMAAVFDDNDLLQKDFQGFKDAMSEYQSLREEGADLKTRLDKPEKFGAETGKEIAAIVAGLLSGVIILGLSFLYFLGG